MSDNYAVFGNPIKHSLSPLIHREFARQTGRDITYQRHLVELGQFEAQASAFFSDGGKGLNVTVPFKLDAYRFADKLTERARRAGAVNTLAMQDNGSVLGDNTDGVGLSRDIVVNQKWRVEGCDVLILGAGGAVRGTLEPLLAQKPASIVIANRTEVKARDLAVEFDDLGKMEGVGFAALGTRSFDLVINGTSASLGGSLPPIPSGVLKATTCCYDMMYAPEPTIFLHWAGQQGVTRLADGLGMLVEQAGEAFYLWQGVRPETGSVIDQIRGQLT